MPAPDPHQRPAPRGMTLIEVLVVLVIFALGWFLALPSLDLARPRSGDDRSIASLNEFLEEIRAAAFEQGIVQRVGMTLGQDELTWGEKTFDLPSLVSRCTVNGANPGGTSFSFTVYPTGITDEVRMVLLSGLTLACRPLSGRFARQ
ncbi:MAG: prepilin-type N-terminal cleavage/methylation domain-containing protein [Thermodesulfobacteriota bacterium]